MYAVIETGGKQYRVMEGDSIYIEKLETEADAVITFEKVIAVGSDDNFKVGTPYVDGVKVTARVIKNGKAKKITIFKYKAKKNYRNKKGHRQPYTNVQIEKIEA